MVVEVKTTLELKKDLCSRCKAKNKGKQNNFLLCDSCFAKAEQSSGVVL